VNHSLLDIITKIAIIIGVIGTVIVAILAIWKEKITSYIAGPKLKLEINNYKGELNWLNNNKAVIYYHLKIKNERNWAPAKKVRILITGISKKKINNDYKQISLNIPLQLTWAYPQFNEMLPDIISEKECDLGCVIEGNSRFELSTYIKPNNFEGFIEKKEKICVFLSISADNYIPKSKYKIEISWNGEWSSNLDEMKRHLIIKEV